MLACVKQFTIGTGDRPISSVPSSWLWVHQGPCLLCLCWLVLPIRNSCDCIYRSDLTGVAYIL